MAGRLFREHLFIIECFKDFYREVMLHKRAIEESQLGNRAGQAGLPEIATNPDMIAKQLITRLEQQIMHAFQRAGELGASLMRDAQYAMVALADEVFLAFEWPGRRDWEVRILEDRVFQTRAAGEKIFAQIDKLLTDRQPDRHELGAVYLMMLGLGFKGQYSSETDAAKIDDIKQRLFVMTQHDRPKLYSQTYDIFSEGYVNTQEDEPVRFFHDVRKWHIFIGVSAFTYMILTSMFWYHSTHDIDALARKISRKSGLEKT